MTSTALVTVLRAAGRAGVAVCLWGDPGIGKPSLIQAAAAADVVPCETLIGSPRKLLSSKSSSTWTRGCTPTLPHSPQTSTRHPSRQMIVPSPAATRRITS